MNNLFQFVTMLAISLLLLDPAAVQGDKSVPQASDAIPDAEKNEQVKEVKPSDTEAVSKAMKALLGALLGNDEAANATPVAERNERAAFANEAILQQFLPTCRSIVSMDLKFLRLICADMTPEQRQTIRKAAEDGAKQAAKVLAAQQQRAERGNSAVNRKESEPYKSVRLSIAKAIAETLSQEQQALLVDALAKRRVQRKQAAVMSAVSQIDDRLFLTEEQRNAILDDLRANWNEGWETWLAMSQVYGDDQLINLPEVSVVRHLNAEQKRVWKDIPKMNYGWWFRTQDGVDFNNDGWWGPEVENIEAQ